LPWARNFSAARTTFALSNAIGNYLNIIQLGLRRYV